jgi:hypothetical protein
MRSAGSVRATVGGASELGVMRQGFDSSLVSWVSAAVRRVCQECRVGVISKVVVSSRGGFGGRVGGGVDLCVGDDAVGVAEGTGEGADRGEEW